MRTQDLEYFVALVQHMNFQKAAEACDVSQPTLSIQIKKLEEELGIPLLHRKGKGFSLSPSGLHLLPVIENILREVYNLQELACWLRFQPVGVINIGITPTLGSYINEDLCSVFKEKFPDNEIKLHEVSEDNLLSMLDKGQLQLGLLIGPIDNERFLEAQLYEEQFVLGVNSSHPLSNHDVIELKDLKKHKLIMTKSMPEHLHLEPGSEEILNHARSISNDLETIRYMVRNSDNVSFFPKLSTLGNEQNSIKYINIKDNNLSRKVFLMMREGETMKEKYYSFGTDVAGRISARLNPLRQSI
jgi:LysR family hydrogen peroxide-inducible transcriptional activator